MKTAAVYRQTIPFPNAATRRQVLSKLLDILLIAASGVGIAAMLLFVLALT